MTQSLPPAAEKQPFPFNPFAGQNGVGDKNDDAYYLLEPGAQFLRPWIRVPGGKAFVWPVGIEGFNNSVEPTVGVRKFIGANEVAVNVMHLGEERIRMTGRFPGSTSVAMLRALKDIVYARTPSGGKILYIPLILSQAQRVAVARAEFDHPEDDIGLTDITYTIEFVRLGIAGTVGNPPLQDPVSQPQPAKSPRGKTPSAFTVNSKYNTLRKIAKLKLGNTNRWRDLYEKNVAYFRKHKVPMTKVPDYRLPIGTKVSL